MGQSLMHNSLLHKRSALFIIAAEVAAMTTIYLTAVVVATLVRDDDARSFLADVGAQLIGSAVGVYLAFRLNVAMNQNWQDELDRKRRESLLIRLKAVFRINQEHLQNAAQEMQKQIAWMPSFTPYLGPLNSSEAFRIELLDVELAKAIDTAHFELDHVARRIEILLRFEVHGDQQPEEVPATLIREWNSKAETACFVSQLVGERQGAILSPAEIQFLRMKVATIGLAVGLSDVSDPNAKVAEGGAFDHCKKAIDAINVALKENDTAVRP